MMSRFMRRILKLGPIMGDVALSSVGCFAMMRGFRLLAVGKKDRTRPAPLAPLARLASIWRVLAPHSSFWPSSQVKLRQLLWRFAADLESDIETPFCPLACLT